MAFPQSFLISLALHATVVGAAAGTLFFDRGNARERDLRERDFVVVLEEKELEKLEEVEPAENSECSENSEISEISENSEPEPPPPPAADEILVPASTGESVPVETAENLGNGDTLVADSKNYQKVDLNSGDKSVAVPTSENPVPASEIPVPASEISQEKSVESVAKKLESSAGTDTTPATLHYRHRAVPVFPRAERLRGRTGTVVLRLTLSPSGELLSVSVKQSSGSRAFDSAAISAARASTYVPAPNATAPTTAEARYEFR